MVVTIGAIALIVNTCALSISLSLSPSLRIDISFPGWFKPIILDFTSISPISTLWADLIPHHDGSIFWQLLKVSPVKASKNTEGSIDNNNNKKEINKLLEKDGKTVAGAAASVDWLKDKKIWKTTTTIVAYNSSSKFWLKKV